MFFLRGLSQVSEQATKTARRILRLREQCREQILQQFGGAAGNGLKVFECLFGQPIVSVNAVEDLTGTTYPAANHLVQRLVDAQIVREITGQSRNRRYRFDEYLALFAEEFTESTAPASERLEN